MRYYNVYFVNVYSNEPFEGLNVATVLMPNRLSKDEMKKISSNLGQSNVVFLTSLDSEVYEAYYYSQDEEINFCSYATIGLFYTLADKGYIQALEDGKKEVSLYTKYGKVYVELYYVDYTIDSVYIRFSINQVKAGLSRQEISGAFNIEEDDLNLSDDISAYKDNIAMPSVFVELKNGENLEAVVPNLDILTKISDREKIDLFNIVAVTGDNEIEQRSFKIGKNISEVYDLKASIYSFLYYLASRDKINFDKEIKVNKDIIFKLSKYDDGSIRLGGKAHVYLSGVLTI
jgi:PhzF family phenazine biosynthesis protein